MYIYMYIYICLIFYSINYFNFYVQKKKSLYIYQVKLQNKNYNSFFIYI